MMSEDQVDKLIEAFGKQAVAIAIMGEHMSHIDETLKDIKAGKMPQCMLEAQNIKDIKALLDSRDALTVAHSGKTAKTGTASFRISLSDGLKFEGIPYDAIGKVMRAIVVLSIVYLLWTRQ